METAARFSDEDRALLEELEDEALVAALFARQSSAAAERAPSVLPGRASSLIAGVRALEGGALAVAAAGSVEGELSAVFPFLLAEELAKRPPRFVHALAVYFDRIAVSYAEALGRASSDEWPRFSEPYLRARTRSLAAFIALSAERTYLSDYGRRVAGSSLSPDQADAAAHGVAHGRLDDLGGAAQRGARDLTRESALALTALSLSTEACRIAGVDAATSTSIARRAERARATAIDDALAAVLDALTEARARDMDLARLVRAFHRVREVWHWSGRDEAVERFAVDEVTGLAWVIYRQSKWDDLRALLAPCVELYESLAARIEGDSKRHVAYSAKCAQVFVFRSDCERDKAAEWALAERSIKLCPTHRNGRLSVAHLLASRAIARLESTWFPTLADVDAARADIARAEELFPQSTRLVPAKAKLREVTDKLSGAPR